MVDVIGEDAAAKLQVTCRGCAAVLEYTRTEVEHGKTYDYGGGVDAYNTIKCPKCGENVRVR